LTGAQHHLDLAPGQAGRYALLPGDPDRVPLLAQALDGPRPVAQKREFTTWCGALDGELVTVTSTGIGCPSAAIAVEELARVGVETVIRGQRKPARMPVAPELEARWRAWIAGGVLCSEMEAAAIYVVARVLGLRAGGVMLVAGNQELDLAGELRGEARTEDLVRGAVAGLRLLIDRDRQRGGSARSGA